MFSPPLRYHQRSGYFGLTAMTGSEADTHVVYSLTIANLTAAAGDKWGGDPVTPTPSDAVPDQPVEDDAKPCEGVAKPHYYTNLLYYFTT